MIEATTLINDVKGDFEGGSSLSVDWNSLIRRAVKNVLENCRPETLKRRVPIYGGLAKDLYVYYCPSDVLVPSALYTNDGKRKFTFQPPQTFYTKEEYNKFTIEYINGARFIVIRHYEEESTITLDLMDSVGTKTGGSPALNDHNFLTGAGAIEATFTDAGVEFGDTITSIDISDYLRGIVLVPVYISDASKLASLEFRLKTDDSNYYKVLSTSDSIGDYFVDGWNYVRFDLANKTTVSSPDSTDITEWSIIGTAESGQTIKLIFDKLTIQKFAPYYFQYYSNKAFINGSTGVWQNTVNYATDDKINFDDDLATVLHYELCMLVTQSATFDAVDGQATRRFEGQLKRAWQSYWAVHPSDEAPMTYSKSPDIPISQDIDYGRLQDDTDFDISS